MKTLKFIMNMKVFEFENAFSMCRKFRNTKSNMKTLKRKKRICKFLLNNGL